MDAKAAITSQYLAALEMLKTAVTQCPDAVWNNPEHTNPSWLLAYHALFYTHLYLQRAETAFTPWPKHVAELNAMQVPAGTDPYTQAEILDYLALCQDEARKQTQNLVLDAPSGFSWIPLNKLELQFYNIRHLQLHVGELCERLWVEAGIEVGWVGRFSND